MADEPQAEASAPNQEEQAEDRKKELQVKRRQAVKDLGQANNALELVGVQVTDKESGDEVWEAKEGFGEAFELIFDQNGRAETALETLDGQIASQDRIIRTVKFTGPLIAAIGEIEVPDATVLPATLHLSDLDERRKRAKTDRAKAESMIVVLDAVEAGLKTAKIPAAMRDDMRPLHLQAKGEKHVVVSVSSGRGGGGGRGGSSKSWKVTGAGNGNDALVGKTVGKGGDFKSFRALLQDSIDEADWNELERKREGGSNYSAHGEARKRLGLVTEEMAPVAAAS